jgi:mannose-6-phosphate isomerase-like protein (cupin superfamily)
MTHDPIHRVSMTFEREGDGLWVHTRMEPGAELPEHFHPTLTETWEVLDGSACVKLDGAWRELTPADGGVRVEPYARHALRNTSGSVARLRTWVTPPGRLEAFLTESARAAREGLYDEHNLPTSLRGAAWVSEFALRFRDETVMCSPPPAMQKVVLPLAARLTRRYRAAV